jgi:replicative DNA helicase
MISETEILDQWTVISDCITKPDEAPQAIDILTTDMFTEPGCRDVFKVFVTLQADGLPTDINHTIERLETAGKLSKALGARLHQAACDARAPQPVKYYAERVREHHRKRRAREILLQHHQNLQDGYGLPETLAELQTALDGLQVNKVVARARRRSDLNSGFCPFPVHVLPNALRGFIRSASSANRSIRGCVMLTAWHPVSRWRHGSRMRLSEFIAC